MPGQLKVPPNDIPHGHVVIDNQNPPNLTHPHKVRPTHPAIPTTTNTVTAP
ncbi:hypothetical protein GCM10010492_12720 [Saccharothrix mutabilis subsp. mutabilis]|uniref:Uncharacterized protein n=1 Tax=Saccharothrix mutabilis subsp. mutabilis TaxID=66855 RepID=A0ABN0TA54_9PSEU